MGNVTIIGGGASGLTAAITAASAGARVTLIEQNDRVGKKILSTGNGRCNYTNMHQEPSCYYSEDPSFPWGIIRQFDAGEPHKQEQALRQDLHAHVQTGSAVQAGAGAAGRGSL